MKELDKAQAIAVQGRDRRRHLARFRRCLARWDLRMPPAEPLVLDFGLGEFDKIGLIECWVANEPDAGYCGKYMFVSGGQSCPVHHHARKRETFFIVKGRVRMTLDGRGRTMSAGDVLFVDTRHKHGFTGLGPALLLEVSMPCKVADNYFQRRDIPIGGNYKPGRKS